MFEKQFGTDREAYSLRTIHEFGKYLYEHGLVAGQYKDCLAQLTRRYLQIHKLGADHWDRIEKEIEQEFFRISKVDKV